MSRKLVSSIVGERAQLRRLLSTYRGLLERCQASEPDQEQLPAFASIVHSFYSGIENIFKRVATELDGQAPRGEAWHSDLLSRMTRPSPKRDAVISETLSQTLRDYMGFRHVFRHAYSFELSWRKMKPLVLGMDDALSRLESELDRFQASLESPSA
ncbi:MAG: hypothetical protein NTW86_17430 [Candidatus Sumerlaeota bacterium]|nr:hypothetical protein [Candidatus Sumerlaeota bacterium]